MTFASLAIFSTLLAASFVAVQATEICQLMGNVSLIWGTTSETLSTATPIGWSTSATAPTDANGRGLPEVRSTLSPTLWGAWACAGSGGGGVVNPRANGGTTSGPPGGSSGENGNGGVGGGATNGVINMFGAIADNSTNLCLTASSFNLPNITITRESCINPLDEAPAFAQAWQWTVSEVNRAVVPEVVDSLVFMGTQSNIALALGTPTNYVPTLVGSGVGAYVALDWLPGELDPADAASAPGLLILFAPPRAA